MSNRIESNLVIAEQAGFCVPADIQTLMLASNKQKDTWYLPSQPDISRALVVMAGEPADTWFPPERNVEYLHQFFARVGMVEGAGQGIIQAMLRLKQNLAVMVLYQDLPPDLDHQRGYPPDGEHGHYAFMSAINLAGGVITLADPSRLLPGNERYFDQSGVVLTQPYTGQVGYQPALKAIYQMRIHDFLPMWWDKHVPPDQGCYKETFVWVDLDSRH